MQESEFEESLKNLTRVYVEHMVHLGFFNLTVEQVEKLTMKLNEDLKFHNEMNRNFIGIIDKLKDNYKL